MAVKDLGPLDYRIPIVDPEGKPTAEFQRRWNQQRSNNTFIGGVTLGSGAPSGVPADGVEYLDISTTPFTLYAGSGGAWHQVSARNFTDLADAPSAYTSAGSKLVRVNSGATGLQFATLSDVLDGLGAAQGDILYRDAAGWAVLAPGASGSVLTANGAGADPSWDTISAILDTVSSTRGSILYRGASGWAALPPGTSGQVLTANGAGADPSWGGGTGGGLAIVQHTINAYNATNTGTPTAVFGAGPTNGNLMIAIGMTNGATAAGSGWTLAQLATGPQNIGVYYKYAGAGESATQVPIATGNAQWCLEAWEISGVSGTWTTDFVGAHIAALSTGFPGTSSTTSSFNTSNSNALVLAFAGGNATTSGTVYSTSTGTVDDTWPGTTLDSLGTFEVALGWHYAVPTSGTAIQSTIASTNGANMSYGLVELKG